MNEKRCAVTGCTNPLYQSGGRERWLCKEHFNQYHRVKAAEHRSNPAGNNGRKKPFPDDRNITKPYGHTPEPSDSFINKVYNLLEGTPPVYSDTEFSVKISHAWVRGVVLALANKRGISTQQAFNIILALVLEGE